MAWGHPTAHITVNRMSMGEPIIYLSRATVCGGRIRVEGFGADATAHAGRMVDYAGDRRLVLR